MTVGLIAGGIVYHQVGGREGARYWMAERALNGTEKHLKTESQRPDGISEEAIVKSFQGVREAIRQQQVNLTLLHNVLKSYHTRFKLKKPSTPEIQTFLDDLQNTILATPTGKE